MTLASRIRAEDSGISLLELLVAITILSLAVLSLVAAGGVAARQLYIARSDMQVWSATQHQAETLKMSGYDGVTSDSATVQGFPMWWEVTGTNPKEVRLRVQLRDAFGDPVEDTLVLFLADPGL